MKTQGTSKFGLVLCTANALVVGLVLIGFGYVLMQPGHAGGTGDFIGLLLNHTADFCHWIIRNLSHY